MRHRIYMSARAHSAFSLVELLVVISIIAVLAALSMAGLRAARISSMTAESMNNIRALAQANTAYAAENGRYVPAENQYGTRRWHGGRTSAQGEFDPELGYLADYLGKSRRVTSCPLFKEMLRGGDSFEDGTGGYGYNAAYIGGRPAREYDGELAVVAETPANVPEPGQTVMFTSTAYARANGLQEYAFAEPPFWDFGDGPAGIRPSPSVHFRFNGKALAAWCDGRVTLEAPGERPPGTNPHGGDADEHHLGWFGPDENNGLWNPLK